MKRYLTKFRPCQRLQMRINMYDLILFNFFNCRPSFCKNLYFSNFLFQSQIIMLKVLLFTSICQKLKKSLKVNFMISINYIPKQKIYINITPIFVFFQYGSNVFHWICTLYRNVGNLKQKSIHGLGPHLFWNKSNAKIQFSAWVTPFCRMVRLPSSSHFSQLCSSN